MQTDFTTPASFSRLFNPSFNRLATTLLRSLEQGARSTVPAADRFETAEGFVLRLELPGVAREHLNLEVEGRRLHLSWTVPARPVLDAESTDPAEAAAAVTRQRSLLLPEGIDAAAVSATLVDGLLELRLPKADHAKRRRVEVR